MRSPGFILPFVIILFCANCSGPATTEILWDEWGVPHIFANTDEELFHAFGYAQAQSHGDTILRLYGQARGRAAEYWGEDQLDSDRWVWTNSIPDIAGGWLAKQDPKIRRFLDAYCAGLNDYVAAHPGKIDDRVKVVLPVVPEDVLAHILRVLHFTFVVNPNAVRRDVERASQNGSNAWAIAPSRSESGNAMLLINPHLPWSGMMLWYEAQLTSPSTNSYGAALVGMPFFGVGFSDFLGWAHTVNTHDGYDLYKLTLKDDGYLWEGRIEPFEVETRSIKVLTGDGQFRTEPLTIRRSIHGPVVDYRERTAIALRVVGTDQPALFEQYWDMARARNLDEFETALRRLQMPMFTVMYADRDGHIMHLFGGRTPVRPQGDWAFWQRPVPGDTPATLWTEILPYDQLPRALDPASGWLQNANDPPWTTTFPSPLDPSRFPPYLAPHGMGFRAQRSARLLTEDRSITFEEMVRYKHSTRVELADRILDHVFEAVRRYGGPDAKRGAEVLAAWDRQTLAESRGAVLFQSFVEKWSGDGRDGSGFAQPWSPEAPRRTPLGLASPRMAADALAAAVIAVEKEFGSADVAWGKVNRLQVGGVDLPANGGPGHLGIFRVVNFHEHSAFAGDSFVAAIEFSKPVRAQVLMSYGNSTQPGSPHRGDQLSLFAQQRLRPVWRTREEIETHLESKTTF